MKWISKMPGVFLLALGLAGEAQTVALPAGASHATGGEGAGVASPDTRSEKQKALAKQVDQLFDMATELKVQVDKTNKNILSLKVVQDAEGIEKLAKGMREHAKR